MSGAIRKLNRGKPVAKQVKAALVPTGFEFAGCQVFVCVPWDSGLTPSEVAKDFSDTTREMFERAQCPNLRDMYEATQVMQGRIGEFKINVEN